MSTIYYTGDPLVWIDAIPYGWQQRGRRMDPDVVNEYECSMFCQIHVVSRKEKMLRKIGDGIVVNHPIGDSYSGRREGKGREGNRKRQNNP